MIDSWHFSKLLFDESIDGYGYEDILFGEKALQLNCSILHTDNPVLHDGLEDNATFLIKTKNAIKNLVKMNQNEKLMASRITKFYQKLYSLNLLPLFRLYWRSNHESIYNRLVEGNGSVRLYLLYKLGMYDDEMRTDDKGAK